MKYVNVTTENHMTQPTQLALNLDGGNTVQLNWEIFEKILGGIPEAKLKTMTQMDVCTHLYEATAMHYSLKFHEEKNRRVKYETKVIEKVGDIAKRDRLIQSLVGTDEDKVLIKEFY